MRISAKVDYALRAVIELGASGDGPVKGERSHADIVRSQRGVEGG